MTDEVDQPYLRLERRFEVPPETVFDTFTKPEKMRIWWGENVEFAIDLRVGGQWTITRQEGGEVYVATGEYLAIDRPSLVRYTFAMPQFSPDSDTISIKIAAENGGTLLIFEHSGNGIANELRDLPPGDTSATEAGWQQGFDLMASAWSKPT